MPLFDDGRQWLSDVHWGVTGCKLLTDENGEPCWRAAELLWDCGERERGVPACVTCADLVLERMELAAVGAIFDETVGGLPPLRPW